MNNRQEIRLNMYLSVRNFMLRNEGNEKDMPGFAENYAILLETIGQIQSIGEKQLIDQRGIALRKNNLRDEITRMATDLSRKISAYAKNTENEPLLMNVRYNSSDFDRMSYTIFRNSVKLLYDNIEEHIAVLAEYGITPDSMKVFLEKIEAYNLLLLTPRSSITDRKIITQKLAALFETADAAIETMDYGAGIVSVSKPDFYAGYMSARKLVSGPGGPVALRAKVTDASGKPVKGVLFILTGSNGNGQIKKKSAARGGFIIKNLAKGNYLARISKPGYKTQEVTVVVAEGERAELRVVVEKG